MPSRNLRYEYSSLGPNDSINTENYYDDNIYRKMGRKWSKFRLLMWKNWLLQYRRPVQTLFEIVAPVFFSMLLVLIRSLVEPEVYPPQIYEPFCLLETFCQNNENVEALLAPYQKVSVHGVSLAYSPRNEIIDKSMDLFKSLNIKIEAFNNSKQLENHFANGDGKFTFAAIQFDDKLFNQSTIPNDIEMSIRFPAELRVKGDIFGQNDWKTNLLYPVYQMAGPRNFNDSFGSIPAYYGEGFLTVQMLVTYCLIAAQKGMDSMMNFYSIFFKVRPPMIQMQRFPYASWTNDPILKALESFVGMIIMLSFVYTCINTVKMITAEKEKQLKESMKIMGLPNWLHWTAWFIKTFVYLTISAFLIVLLLKISWYPNTSYSVFTHADASVMFIFLLLYICATVTFCFAVSVFFSAANTAATVAGLLWFLSYSPYLFMQKKYDTLSLATKLMASLGSNSAMAYGFQLMIMFEGTGEGINWSNVWKVNTPDDNLTLGMIMCMLIIDSFLYLLLALYVEAIFPGDYGVPLPWYFPFSKHYWNCRSDYVGASAHSLNNINGITSEFLEEEPSHLKAGIQILNLRKVFDKRIAVKGLNLTMYENQITVLLGHNGAGKTTTMSLLTGMFPPTSGTAFINGFDIRLQMNLVRESLGLCPQHNILFDELTVKEHFYFFSKLKGLATNAINDEIAKYVTLLELQPKMDSQSKTLSGGMKRKLCVGIALCGGSKVVMLDEPTAGMDPSARRALWDLLQTQKENRTILLTTHYMDEADLLGDRIAIMAMGQLKCCGSSFFLKKKYGAGYNLIMDKSEKCNPSDVTALLKQHLPNVEINGNVGSELSYLLAENQSSSFQDMLNDLDENIDSLGVQGYGISLTTLEEVFMKVGSDENGNEVSTNNNSHPKWPTLFSKLFASLIKTKHKPLDSTLNESKLTIEHKNFLTGLALIRNQFIAMLMKKVLSFIRTWPLQLIQIFIPVTFLLVAIAVGRNEKRYGELPKLSLQLDSYIQPITVIDDTIHNEYGQFYRNITNKFIILEESNITNLMLNLTSTVPSMVRMKYIVGASFESNELYKSKITAWFNNDPYHTPPLALGLVLNTLYKKFLGKDFNIRYANYPLPFETSTKIKDLLSENSAGFQYAFNIAFSMAFVSSFYVLFYVRERECKSKHLQFVSGVKVYVFWITSFICDLLTFIITALILLLTLASFKEDGFKTVEDIGRLFLILLYFGFSMIPMMYFSAFLFSVPSTGYTRMCLFSVFTGVAAFLVVQVLQTPDLNLEYLAKILHWIFLTVPHYSLATGIRDTFTTFSTNKLCKFVVDVCIQSDIGDVDFCWERACNETTLAEYCCERQPHYFKWESPGIGRNLLFSFGIGFLLFLLLIITEYSIFRATVNYIYSTFQTKTFIQNQNEDDDVLAEKNLIRNTTDAQNKLNYTLVLKNVTKFYKNLLAVNGLCLGVKRYECFGLLGVNGAGKTSTFKMMTGDVQMTAGDAWVQGYSLRTNIKQVHKLIGYCPQFDALLDDITAKETLQMFALLRGVSFDECRYVVKKLASDFDFTQHLNKKVKQLSGGNKRKLSTAVALIGDPPVIYLDEPTTGMDPTTKRYLWNALCRVRDEGKCIILTSHSMEECEALCTRLAIMVNGNFKCLGSSQHLKNKFAKGYTLTIKVRKISTPQTDNIQSIEQFVLRHFPNAVERENHRELLCYYIADSKLRWSEVFGLLERAKRELNIEDYSLGQSSLEQVFLSFTKLQN